MWRPLRLRFKGALRPRTRVGTDCCRAVLACAILGRKCRDGSLPIPDLLRLSIVEQWDAVWELGVCNFWDGFLDEPVDLCLADHLYVVWQSLREGRPQSAGEDFFVAFLDQDFVSQ